MLFRSILSAALASMAVAAPAALWGDNGACATLQGRCVNALAQSYVDEYDTVFGIESCVLGATCFLGLASPSTPPNVDLTNAPQHARRLPPRGRGRGERDQAERDHPARHPDAAGPAAGAPLPICIVRTFSNTTASQVWSQMTYTHPMVTAPTITAQNWTATFHDQLTFTDGPYPTSNVTVFAYFLRVQLWTGYVGKPIPYSSRFPHHWLSRFLR